MNKGPYNLRMNAFGSIDFIVRLLEFVEKVLALYQFPKLRESSEDSKRS